MLGLSKLEAYGIILLIVALAAGAFGLYEHHQGYLDGKKEVQIEFDKFKNEVAAAGLKAEQDKLTKEKRDADQIAAAVTGRDAALARLRVEQSRPRGGFVPNGSGSAANSGKVCYDRAALDAALRKLDTGVSQLVNQGDVAVINALTLLKSWPTAQPTDARSAPSVGR